MKKLKNTDFDKDTIASKLKLSDIEINSPLHELITNLNSHGSWDFDYTKRLKDSIMDSEKLCNHDESILCSHRLQWIVDFIKTNFVPK